MKKILILSLLAFMFFSCERKGPEQIKDVTIKYNLPDNFNPGINYSNKVVEFTGSSASYTFTTDENGSINITGIIPDEYTINTTWEINGREYREIASDDNFVEDNVKVLIRSTLTNYPLFVSEDMDIDLEMLIMKSLLISKLYYSGTKDNLNRNYRTDSFIEIYNNSPETVYLDGKYLALAESMSPAAYLATDDPDYIYTRQICRFPGSGEDYPLEAGESIVIATQSARDHTMSAENSVDLSDADFEVKDLDGMGNPDVKALPIVSNSTSIRYFNLLSGAPNALFLFETDEDILEWQEVYAPGKTSGERFRKVPVSTVLDGVEALKNNAVTGPDINLKRFQDIVDAGFVMINATSGYTNESLERKISSMDGDRIILKDSNNSTDDFVLIQGPEPRNYDHPQLLNQ
jgi:hypothetical protein